MSYKHARHLETGIRLIIWYSVATYVVELFLKSEDSLSGPLFFLWSERLVATLFTLEIVWRYRDAVNRNQLKEYLTGMFWVDLVSVLPFWLGFFVSDTHLDVIRTLRMLRLLKLYRYNQQLQLLGQVFVSVAPFLKSACASMFILSMFAASMIHIAEKDLQPDKFGHIGNCLWFCLTSATTVGYGDMSPATPLGKLVTVCVLYGPAIFVCAAVVGIVGSAYQTAIENQKQQKELS